MMHKPMISSKRLMLCIVPLCLLLSCKKDSGSPGKDGPEIIAYSLTAKVAAINSNVGGYYEALPPDYNDSLKYPLLVFLHGLGSLGNGTTEIKKVLDYGLPKLLGKKTFPISFNANGKQQSFIIVMPQFKEIPNNQPGQVGDVLSYAKAHYPVDESRVYLVGASMGGGVVWDYPAMNDNNAKGIAAMVPICGGTYPSKSKAATIARNNIPVWAFHNKDDKNIDFQFSQNFVSWINENNPAIPAKFTIRDTGGHDAWTLACDPEYREDGLNIYEWLLQYKR